MAVKGKFDFLQNSGYDVIKPPENRVNGVGTSVPHDFLKIMYKKSPLSQKCCFGHEITAGLKFRTYGPGLLSMDYLDQLS